MMIELIQNFQEYQYTKKYYTEQSINKQKTLPRIYKQKDRESLVHLVYQ